ncbi:MAG: hypothetical protein R2911_13175 [Caldilineaceae bacterium]
MLTLIVLAALVQRRTDAASLTPTPYDNMVRVAQRIEQLEQRGDAILLLEPEQTQRFAMVYHGHLPTYGLFAQQQLDEWANVAGPPAPNISGYGWCPMERSPTPRAGSGRCAATIFCCGRAEPPGTMDNG